jgi:hypothetical protein
MAAALAPLPLEEGQTINFAAVGRETGTDSKSPLPRETVATVLPISNRAGRRDDLLPTCVGQNSDFVQPIFGCLSPGRMIRIPSWSGKAVDNFH